MFSLFSRILYIKNKIFSQKIYLWGFFGILLLFFGTIIYLMVKPMVKPKTSEIPPIPSGNLGEGLVSYWAFNEKGGQIAYDATRKNHNGRLGFSNGVDSGDPERYKKGKIGRALKFDGQDDYIFVEDHPELRISREISLEGWFMVLGDSNPSPKPVWLPDFRYRKQVVLDNIGSEKSFGSAQVLIRLDTSTLIKQGKMQANCQDIRFTDSDETTLLPYWIESGCNTEKTKVWVKLAYIPANNLTKNIYLYYGNPEAKDQSDFAKTMEIPPIQWWQFPEEKERHGKAIKAISIDQENNIVAVGWDTYTRDKDLQWRTEWISSEGSQEGFQTENPSFGPDEINDIVFDLKNKKNIPVLGGYDFLPGNSQWRIEKSDKWTLNFNFSPGSDEVKAVAIDSERNILVGGYDSIPGDTQWHLIKLDTDGKMLWEYILNPSNQADIITDVKVDSRNNVVIAGYEKSLGNDRWRIEKLSPDKKLLWSYRFNISDGADILNAIAIDSKDNIVAVGYDFYPGNAEWRVIKLDPEGKKLWQWNFDPSPGFDELKSVDVDSNNNILIAGHDSSPGDLQWDILKFSPNGEEIWQWQYNPTKENDEIKDIKVDSENNIIITGTNNLRSTTIKLSEKKLLFPLPKVSIWSEKVQEKLPKNIILAKLGSYQISADKNQLTGVINQENFISVPIRLGEWNHFALTYDGKLMRLYLNGDLVSSKGLPEEIQVNLNNLIIGYNFNGLLDELRIYNRSLLPKEIKQLLSSKKSR